MDRQTDRQTERRATYLDVGDISDVVGVALLVLALVRHPRLFSPEQHLRVVKEVNLKDLGLS